MCREDKLLEFRKHSHHRIPDAIRFGECFYSQPTNIWNPKPSALLLFLTGYVFSGHCFTHLIVLLANFAMLEFLIAFTNYLINPMLSITNPNQMKQLTVLILSLSNYGLSSGFFFPLSLFSSPFYSAKPGIIGMIKLPPLTLTDSFIQIFKFICRTILGMSEQSKHHGIQRGFF